MSNFWTDGEDFVLWFLENSDTGYCVHFATAAAVLLRYYGVPARYVTGYFVSASGEQWTSVTEDDAHAWVEYFDGMDWCVLDPTPADLTSEGSGGSENTPDTPENSGQQTPQNDQSTAPQPSQSDTKPVDAPAETVNSSPQSADTAEITAGKSGSRGAVLGWMLGILGFAGLWFLYRILRLSGRNAQLLHGSANRRAIMYYRHIRYLSKFTKDEIPDGLFQIAEKAKFSQHKISSDELAQMHEQGSFPYILQISQDREMVHEYLLGLYNTIVLKDVISRKKITDVMMLQSVVRFLADNIGNISVIKRISDTMTSLGRKITSHTVENYISALTDSFIFYPVQRYDAKGKQLLKTGQKLYLADVGLRQVINGTKGGDMGHILENVVYMELARRGGEIYVGKAGDAEIDFIVINGEHKAYYQVSLSVRDESTMQRELSPLLSIPDNFPKYLLTMDNDPVTFHDGIKQQYVLDWLME